ncbi:MAG: tRNA uridine-5-carboxymethylaminomethyl(34) synthesis GTPase MnmE [Epsilonproteobacteria bacterium]|nr:tRNA uridine-5-carboxymethylaminomethyl(34) synthesis GTPase MnmE [Campylobacterota bacterium]NPA65154.1 tRNA uridine-5-carboxymethylaminomethyl(34) synthesis GTPase MnmE [Campylobacterota bacterium]
MSLERNDTIAAVATAHGVGAISIVRVSGPEALTIARAITKRSSFTPRHATLADLYDAQDSLIDQALVIYFQGPKSFTGEDVVEFQCHGGIVVAQMVLQRVLELGARLAMPGEFSKRAFLHGKIDLSEAEAIAKIIEAKSEDAARILARQLRGELKEYIEDLRDKLIKILAYVEVNIDYAEEDLPKDLSLQIQEQLNSIATELDRVVESSRRRSGLLEGFKIAIVGKPNTGKSSLLNALLDYERAIVSDIAGTTRDTIEEQVRIGTHLVRFVDTAGIREASDAIERIGVERSIKAIQESDIVVAMFDASAPLDDEDRKIIDLLKSYQDQKSLIVVLNKIDLGKVAKLPFEDVVELSVKEGIEPLIRRIEKILDNLAGSDEILLVSRRQIEAVESAKKAIEEAKLPLQMGELEIFAFHINEAIRSIASITRPMESEELLDKMFGEFCLGK